MKFITLKSTLVGLVLLLLCNSMLAQRRAEFKFIVGDETGNEVKLTAGVDDRATDSLDMALGEQFTPGHPGFYIGMVSAGIIIENNPWFSYKSYMRIPSTDKFLCDYVINVNSYEWRRMPFFFKWNYPLPSGVDSARIEDPFGGDLYSIPIDEQRKSIPITNEGLNNYLLKIWYSNVPLDVVENEKEQTNEQIEFKWYNEHIILKAPLWRSIEIYNLMGIQVWKTCESSTNTTVETTTMPNGIYFIRATTVNGTIISKKIILAR